MLRTVTMDNEEWKLIGQLQEENKRLEASIRRYAREREEMLKTIGELDADAKIGAAVRTIYEVLNDCKSSS